MKNIFIGVNYGTSDLIHKWYKSISMTAADYEIYLVDNYSSEQERIIANKICKELDIEFIQSENIGYGRALNKCFRVVKHRYGESENYSILAGNIDIRFLELPLELPDGNYVFIPSAMERHRNRNPFLTICQKRFLHLHKLSLASGSPLVMLGIISILKFIGVFPSRIWTLHGSLFCFNSCILRHGDIFNDNTFLYSEELEFGSYVEHISGSEFLHADIVYEHMAHASTSKIISSKADFFSIWKPGFNNWLERWSHYEQD